MPDSWSYAGCALVDYLPHQETRLRGLVSGGGDMGDMWRSSSWPRAATVPHLGVVRRAPAGPAGDRGLSRDGDSLHARHTIVAMRAPV